MAFSPCVSWLYVICCEHAILPFNENTTFTFNRENTFADGVIEGECERGDSLCNLICYYTNLNGETLFPISVKRQLMWFILTNVLSIEDRNIARE